MTQIDTIRHKYTQIDTYSHTIPHNMTHSWVGHKKSHIYIYIYIYIQSFHTFIQRTSHHEQETHQPHHIDHSKKILQSKNKTKQKKFIQSFIQKKKSFNHSKKFIETHRIHNL